MNEIPFDMTARVALESHENIMCLHARALACHCECLGMNAENSAAICAGEIVPYNDKRYGEAMEKWGLTDEKGNPTI
jgi:hypothetical protein